MTGALLEVLLVTKPVAPPWNDGTLNLTRCLLQGDDVGCRFRVPVPAGAQTLGIPHAIEEAIYPEAGAHGTTGRNNLAMLGRLLRPARAQAMHFLFAPSARTGGILRILLAARNIPTIHTLCSRPQSFDDLRSVLFADHHIVLSRFTEQKLRSAGVRSVERVDPGIFEPDSDSATGTRILSEAGIPENTPIVLYAGDLEFSKGAETVIRAMPEALKSTPHHVVLACREKTARAAIERQRLQELAATLGVESRTHFLGTVPSFHSLLGKADLLLFPTANTYAKLDLPLVLLEALALGIPLVVAEEGPVGELLDENVGFGVKAENPADLGTALNDILTKGTAGDEKSELCRRAFLQRFQAKQHAQAVGNLYRRWIV